jgi:hypothetical protein
MTCDLAHRLVEAQAEHLNEEVDGVASLVARRPTPIGPFDSETRKGREDEVAGVAFEQLHAAFLQQWSLQAVKAQVSFLSRLVSAPASRPVPAQSWSSWWGRHFCE